MAIVNVSRYFDVDYYNGLILATTATKEQKEKNEKIIAQRNQLLRNAAFFCPEYNALPNEKSFTLWTAYPGLMMGTGYSHDGGLKGDICAGLSLDYVTGLPYLPGSSLKGVLRSVFRHQQYVREIIGDDNADVKALEYALFGERSQERERASSDGRLVFLDAFPEMSIDAVNSSSGVKLYKLLELDNITPHHQNEELGLLAEPNPLTFMKVRPGVKFRFRILMPDVISYGENMSIEAEKLLDLFRNTLLDIGAGAKTNVGFGCFTEDMPARSTVTAVTSTAARNTATTAPVQSAQPAQVQHRCKGCNKPVGINPHTKKPSNYCAECQAKRRAEANGGNAGN